MSQAAAVSRNERKVEYEAFLSDSEKSPEDGMFKSNVDKLLQEEYSKEGKICTPDDLEEGILIERKVKFDICFNRPNNYKPPEISFEEIDKYDFNKGFIEYIVSEKYVHLYFDFDSIKSEDEFYEVLDWLDSLTEVFGPYSYGGYTSNESLSNYVGFRYFPEGKHWLSMHAIFYQTCISTSDLQAIMKHTEKNGFSTKGIHHLCDPNVYKLVPRPGKTGSRQLFRHVLSNKIKKIGDPENVMNHGTLIDDAKPSDHIVQIRGNEPIITRDKWSTLFTLAGDANKSSANKPAANPVKKVVEISNSSDFVLANEFSNLDAHNDLIEMPDEELLELLNEFAPEYDNFKSITINLLHSPYEEEHAKSLLEKWYNQRVHTNISPIDAYSNTCYEKLMSNRWFFSIINHLPEDRKKYWLSKYSSRAVDMDAKIDVKDKFTLRTLRETDYSLENGKGINVSKFISDLKKCVVFINLAKPVYVVKDYDSIEKTIKLSIINSIDFSTLMQSINIGKYFKNNKWKNVNAYMIYNEGKNKNYIMKDGINFYDENPNIFSYFAGYDYNILDKVDESKIQLYLHHIREVISENNEEMYEYILNWISFIFQNPCGKTNKVIVITGDQGTGKNAFTNIICDLMNRYASRNVTNIDHLSGKFNTVSENMKLIICNELSSAETNKFLNFDTLKSIISDDTVMMNSKGIDPRKIQNVANLIMLSNHFAPVKIEGGDRRYVVTHSSSVHKGDDAYFDKLFESFKDKDFYDNLFTFFMKRDISKYNPRKIPDTEVRKAIQDVSKSAYESFVQQYIKDFIEGIECKEAYNLYVIYAKDNGYSQANVKTFKTNILPFADYKQVRRNGKRPYVYKLKDDCKMKFDLNDDPLCGVCDANDEGEAECI